jgi:hypothetical protein
MQTLRYKEKESPRENSLAALLLLLTKEADV